jgi:hypothetical protein
LGRLDPEESEHWRGFAGILGQIVTILKILCNGYICIGRRAKITETPKIRRVGLSDKIGVTI